MLPVTDDRDTGPFFEAARECRLAYAACDQCRRAIHPPMPWCPHCGGRIGWRTASGRATLYGFTLVEHQIHPAFPTPYTVVLVELADSQDVRLVGHLAGKHELRIGQPMEVWFEDKGDGVVLPQWRPMQPESP